MYFTRQILSRKLVWQLDRHPPELTALVLKTTAANHSSPHTFQWPCSMASPFLDALPTVWPQRMQRAEGMWHVHFDITPLQNPREIYIRLDHLQRKKLRVNFNSHLANNFNQSRKKSLTCHKMRENVARSCLRRCSPDVQLSQMMRKNATGPRCLRMISLGQENKI